MFKAIESPFMKCLKKCFNKASNAILRVPGVLCTKTDQFLLAASKSRGVKRRAYKAFAGVTGFGMMAAAIPSAAVILGGSAVDSVKRKLKRQGPRR